MTGEPHKVVLIEWEDATYELDPQNIDEIRTQMVRTVGWIVREDDDAMIVASEYNDGVKSGYRQVTAIPHLMVRKIVQLRKK